MLRFLGRDNRILMLSLVLWALGEGLWANLLVIYAGELGATPRQTGLMFAIGSVARIMFLIPSGWLIDRYGPRILIIASWSMGIASTIVLALAPGWQWLIPGEILYGGSIFAVPALNTYVLQALPRQTSIRESNSALPTVYAAFWVGIIFSPPIGGLIAERFTIRSTFLVAIAFNVLSMIVVLLSHDYGAPSKEGAPSNWGDLARNRPFVGVISLFFIVTIFVLTGWQFVSKFVFDVRHYSLQLIGLLTGLLALGSVVLNLALGRFRPRWGLVIAQALTMLSMIILLASGAVPAAGLSFLLLGAVSTTHSLMGTTVTHYVPARQHGMAFGITELSIALGATVAPLIAGTLYEIRPQLPFVVSIVALPVAIAATAIVLGIPARIHVPAAQIAHGSD